MRVAIMVLACTVAFVPRLFAQSTVPSSPIDHVDLAGASEPETSSRVLRYSFQPSTQAPEPGQPSLRTMLDRSILSAADLQLPTVASNPDKTTHLVIGLAGVGLAAASIPMIANSDCRLGEYCTKLQVGTYMLATGGVLAAFYLWKAFK